jgi:hypothetical protein
MASDQEMFTVPENVARMSQMITNMLDGETCVWLVGDTPFFSVAPRAS